eukprot:XP_001700220.1 predicted protein [Chlamydomonas reinhardtii]
MEAKALAWLAAAWPEGGRSVGSTVMALAKALTAGTVRAIESPEPVTVERPAAAAEAAAGAGAEEVWRVRLSEQVADPSKDLSLAIELDPKAARRSGLRAREAALFFVRDLPVDSGVRFNMTVFGSSHNSLYSNCKPYDSKTEKEAVAWIQSKVHANLGGTEILGTMQHIYNSPIAAGYTREIIFLTDGGISGHEEQAVYDLVNPKAKAPVPAAARTHVLSLGIGHGVHRSLLDGMSTRSDGAVVYVVDDEAIAAKTAFLKKAATAAGAALRPRLVARNALVRPAPHVLPQRVFAGEPLHVLMEVVSSEPDAALELTADWAEPESAAGAAPLTLSLPLGPALASAEEGEALPVLHAMAYIGSLMAGTSPLHVRSDGTTLAAPPSADTVKEAVVRLAVAEHLVTPHTSAVGVSLRRDPAAPEAAANVVEMMWCGTAPGGGGGRGSAAPAATNQAFASADLSLRGEKIEALSDLSCGVQQEAQCFTKKALKKKSAAASLGDAVGGAMGSLFGGLFGSGSRGASAVCAKPAQQALQGPGSAGGSCVAAEFAAPCGAAAPEAEQEESCCDDGADEMEAGDCDAGFSVPAMKESGYWAAGPELAAALGVPVVDLTSAAGAAGSGGSTAAVLRPAGLTDDAWATVVVLAVLRRCLAAQREVWADMEAKALAWLAAAWPEGGRSVGSTVMALAKALTVEA